MERMPTWMAVVAAAIRDGDGRLLLQQALPGKRHAGQWEFPGGKVESAETPRLALAREVFEELGLRLDPASMRPRGVAEDPGSGDRGALVLILYDSPRWRGTPEAREGQAFGWFAPREAGGLDLAPLDRDLLEGLAD